MWKLAGPGAKSAQFEIKSHLKAPPTNLTDAQLIQLAAGCWDFQTMNIADDENVIALRLWHQLLSSGIMANPSNFSGKTIFLCGGKGVFLCKVYCALHLHLFSVIFIFLNVSIVYLSGMIFLFLCVSWVWICVAAKALGFPPANNGRRSGQHMSSLLLPKWVGGKCDICGKCDLCGKCDACKSFLRKRLKMWNEWAGQAENGGVSVDKFAVVYDDRGCYLYLYLYLKRYLYLYLKRYLYLYLYLKRYLCLYLRRYFIIVYVFVFVFCNFGKN